MFLDNRSVGKWPSNVLSMLELVTEPLADNAAQATHEHHDQGASGLGDKDSDSSQDDEEEESDSEEDSSIVWKGFVL